MPEPTYLHIRGTLAENMVYRAEPGDETSRPERREAGDPAFQLVLLDEVGQILTAVVPQVLASGCQTVNDPLRFRVCGSLPLHPDGVAYELRRGDLRIHRAAIPPEAPVIGESTCQSDAEGLQLRWQAAPGQGITYSIVAVMEQGRRIVLARHVTEVKQRVALDRIPVPGKGKIYVSASDGVRSSETEVASIDVPSRPPTVYIVSPADGSRLRFGQPVSALGCCLDMAGRPCPPDGAAWLLDGEVFAAGTTIAAIDHVQPGIHRLTLAMEDGASRVESSVSIDIEEPDADHREWENLIASITPQPDSHTPGHHFIHLRPAD